MVIKLFLIYEKSISQKLLKVHSVIIHGLRRSVSSVIGMPGVHSRCIDFQNFRKGGFYLGGV